ncbi:MAG: class I SAM-dependent methyltransferase [Ktedonobacterales bacterium]
MRAQDMYTSGAYLQKAPTWHVEESAGKVREVLRMLDRNRLAPHTIADAGCGVGEVLRLLQAQLPRDCEFTGYDVSPQAIALAQSRAGPRLRFIRGSAPDANTAPVDLLLALDVVEHLEDYYAFLRDLHARATYTMVFFPLDLSVQTVIRPYGLLHTREAYGHLHYFTKETALRALEDSGYTVLDYCYTADALNLPTKLLGRHLLNLPRRLLFALNRDFAVHLLGGYRLLVLAR